MKNQTVVRPAIFAYLCLSLGFGQLTGLIGIQITDGKHSYDFAYTLPDSC